MSMANYQSRGYWGLKQFIAVPLPSEMIDFCTVEH